MAETKYTFENNQNEYNEVFDTFIEELTQAKNTHSRESAIEKYFNQNQDIPDLKSICSDRQIHIFSRVLLAFAVIINEECNPFPQLLEEFQQNSTILLEWETSRVASH